MEVLLRDFEEYCFGNDHGFANAIDSYKAPVVSLEDSKRGVRKYLGESPNLPMKSRQKFAGSFIKHCRATLDRLKENGQERLEAPIFEIGYTSEPAVRLAMHQAHMRSCKLMNIMNAVTDHRFPNKYEIWQSVISVVGKPSHAGMSEVLLTRLAQGYITNGTGFSHYPAGISIPLGVRKVKVWREYWKWIKENSQFHANSAAEIRLIEAPSSQGGDADAMATSAHNDREESPHEQVGWDPHLVRGNNHPVFKDSGRSKEPDIQAPLRSSNPQATQRSSYEDYDRAQQEFLKILATTEQQNRSTSHPDRLLNVQHGRCTRK